MTQTPPDPFGDIAAPTLRSDRSAGKDAAIVIVLRNPVFEPVLAPLQDPAAPIKSSRAAPSGASQVRYAVVFGLAVAAMIVALAVAFRPLDLGGASPIGPETISSGALDSLTQEVPHRAA